MLGTIKDQTLFLLLGSVGILFFDSLGYGIYTMFRPLSLKFSYKTNEHARMNELRISYGHNIHNHCEEKHIH